MFRLRAELLERLKVLAAHDNRSLNNYVETILMDVAYSTPNEATITAIREARDDASLFRPNIARIYCAVNMPGIWSAI